MRLIWMKRFLSTWCLCVALPFLAHSAASLKITEFMADNTGEVKVDENGDSSDWVEIYNPSSSSIQLGGFYLTDNPDIPMLWRGPSVNIPAQGHLLIFLSGKNRSASGAPIHANFQLRKDSGYLALRDLSGTLLDSIGSYPPQRTGISYGVSPGGTWAYQLTPTPGQSNSGPVVPGFVEEVHFSQKPGFYEQPFQVHLSTVTPGATIRYTTNGSRPGPSTGVAYSGPITITNTTLLRAGAWKEGLGPSASTTRSFIFLESVLTQTGAGFPTNWGPTRADYAMDPVMVGSPLYKDEMIPDLLSLPSMSVVMDMNDLFGPQGIYSNPMLEEGDQIEKPGSLE